MWYAVVESRRRRGVSTDSPVAPLDPGSSTDPQSRSRSRDTPYSPRPRLFDNLPVHDGPVASDVLSEADYRRLRSNAFRPSVFAGPLLVSATLGMIIAFHQRRGKLTVTWLFSVLCPPHPPFSIWKSQHSPIRYIPILAHFILVILYLHSVESRDIQRETPSGGACAT